MLMNPSHSCPTSSAAVRTGDRFFGRHGRKRAVHPIRLRGKTLHSVSDRLGSDENLLTFALGWCLSCMPGLLEQVVKGIGVNPPCAAAPRCRWQERQISSLTVWAATMS